MKLNRRQITCLWIYFTVLCPLSYLFVQYLITTKSQIGDTHRIVWEAQQPLGNEHTYRIQDTNGAVYLLKSDKAVLTESFIDEQIKQQHLQPMSPQQIEALDKNKKLRDRRAIVVEYALIGLFVVSSFTGLYIYRTRAI